MQNFRFIVGISLCLEKCQTLIIDCVQVRTSFDEQLEGTPSSEFVAISYSQQLVNGINYFVKVS